MLGLASAMGIGRFALTPIMPLMLHDAGLDMGQGSWLATANYIGYLAGALACIARPPRPIAAMRWGLVFVAASTLAMGLTRVPFAWIAFRFVAGVASAMVLVGVSAWAVPVLKRLGREQWSGRVFAGVGAGIAFTGLASLGAGLAGWGSRSVWLVLGAVAAALVPLLWHPLAADQTPYDPRGPGSGQGLGRASLMAAACYGLFGFGYIIPATFLPAFARGTFDDPAIFGLMWPVLGAAAAISTMVAAAVGRHISPRRQWIFAQWLLAIGVLAPLHVVNVITLAVAAVCVGGSFMVITMAGIKEALRLGGTQGSRAVGLMTAAFAIGQIAGPVVVALLRETSGFPVAPSLIAALGLVVSNCILTWGIRESDQALAAT
jgi:MFS family permease